jgi:molybdate-binding protein/DNA-binding transcriptional regulator YhcF (GntR family)
MTNAKLYQTIAEAVSQDVRAGKLQPGDPLPPVREMAAQWGCAPGTVQRAYRELAEMGVVVSHSGHGTHIAAPPSDDTRMLKLVNHAEAFLIELVGTGYPLTEVERALRLALDQLHTRQQQIAQSQARALRFVGSHDPALSLVSSQIASQHPIEMTFAGSLNGLLALAHGGADFAGCHLWDSETRRYNLPFVERLLHGRAVALLTVGHRRLGLITTADNPLTLRSLADLTKEGVRFVNRQGGAGTRLWLDDQLAELGVSSDAIAGYAHEVSTHAAVARTIAQGAANAGVGVEAAALAYGLGFIPLTTEQYDMVIPAEHWESAAVQALVRALLSNTTREAIGALGGYDTTHTGELAWVG